MKKMKTLSGRFNYQDVETFALTLGEPVNFFHFRFVGSSGISLLCKKLIEAKASIWNAPEEFKRVLGAFDVDRVLVYFESEPILDPAADGIDALAQEVRLSQRRERRETAGTPKTLEESLRFGINIETGNEATERCALAGQVESYVIDFLSQKFTAALYDAQVEKFEGGKVVSDLWFHITGKKIG